MRCWQFQRQNVLENIAIQQVPILQCLADPKTELPQTAPSYLPILSGIPLDDIESRTTTSGAEVQCTKGNLSLDSAWVTKVEWVNPGQLRFVLSDKGDEELRRFTKDLSSPSLLGLVVRGWVEGVSVGTLRDRQITFRMGHLTKQTHLRIQAAIRGPSLPCEFELLE